MHIWWIRHAPIETTGCYTGQSDVEALLPRQPLSLALEFPEDALWLSSPLKRAVQTAQMLMAHHYLPHNMLQLTPELKEQSFGVWEGQNYYDVWQEAEHAFNWEKPELVRPENGESFADVCTRVDSWIEASSEKYCHKNLVIIAHAGPIRAALRHAYAVDIAHALSREIECGSVTHIDYSQLAKPEVKFVNQPCWVIPQT